MAFKIKEIRTEKGVSQEELAEKSGVSRVIISGLETGERKNTTVKTLSDIAAALGVKVCDIFSA